MSALAALKLVAAKRPNSLPGLVQRRNKVVARIAEQIALAQALQEGHSHAVMKQRKVLDTETGESKLVAVPKQIKPWWFIADSGKLCVQLRYGAKLLTLGSKGQTAVELTANTELVPTLELLKQAVEAGELDQQIEATSGSVKAGFKR